MSTGTHEATVYLQLKADTWENFQGTVRVNKIRVANSTSKRPGKPQPGAVVIALKIQVPDAVFLPLRPEATVVIPSDLAEQIPIVAVAIDPHASVVEVGNE